MPSALKNPTKFRSSSPARLLKRACGPPLRPTGGLGVTLNVIEQVPQQLHSPAAVFDLVWADPMRAEQRLKELSVPIAKHQSLQAFSRAMFKNYSQVPGVRIIRLDPLFCDQRVCAIGTPDTSYYQDPSHLSQDGAARAIPILTKLLTTRS
jgi:hypothetical protein